ncbi:DUF11 domain-containing protein [Deinococcus lacus]|uniref:DUF11 domain-containing protein n=1 Tax=Deinococcus lacus TaxID=392561 RepID=A0ABW1YBY0_9DEIO
MKLTKKRTLLGLTALLLAAAPAHAQQIDTSLPLTSVGDRLMWSVGDQTLTLNVPVSGRVRLDLYSPRVDQRDYRSDTYYGDEQYDGNTGAVATTFTLQSLDGKTLLTRTFTPGPHGWETLLDEDLPAGQYRVLAQTQGNGKNTFALRLTGVSAAVSADHLTVNVHSEQWTPVVNVRTDGDGYSLRMYDGDGAGELEARLRYPDGHTEPVAVSGDLEWTAITIPEAAGHYVVELRQVPGAVQYSNTVGFSLHRAEVLVPLTLTQVDETGLLEITAELLLPSGNRPTSVDVEVADQAMRVNGEFQQRVKAGRYPVEVAPVPGAAVTSDKPAADVPRNGVGKVHIQVRPEVALKLEVDKPQVCMGDVVTLTAQASTAYREALPLDLQLQAGGLRLAGAAQKTGTFQAGVDGVLRLEGVAEQTGTVTVRARLGDWNQEQVQTIEVLPQSTALQLRREIPQGVQPGETATVRLLLTNTGTQPAEYDLTEAVSGATVLDSASFKGTLAAGETRELSYQVRADAAGDVTLQSSLNSGVCAVTQNSSGVLRVAAPPTVQRSSEVYLPFDAPVQAKTLIVAHRIPAGATYQMGSARLDDRPLEDPIQGPNGTLYWPIEAQTRGAIHYSLGHTEALPELPKASLIARYNAERLEVLEGDFDSPDFSNAKTITTRAATENPGGIKLPLNGTVYRNRDKISLTVELPVGQTPQLTVNGKAVDESQLGTNTQDGPRGVQRLTYVGVQLTPGANVIRLGDEQIEVVFAGVTRSVELTPVQLVADGSTPIRVKVRVLDEFGTPTSQPSLTVKTNLEPYIRDGRVTEAGYQVTLIDGEGELVLRPQSLPTPLELRFLVNDKVITKRFELVPDRNRFGVGLVSATLGLDGNIDLESDLTWTARAYYEGPMQDGKLFVAADKDGLANDRNPNERYPISGDASVHTVPLQGIDPVAAIYDHPGFRAAYQRTQVPLTVLPVGETMTALTVETKQNPRFAGFAAYLPADRIVEEPYTPDGTRILRLRQGGISESSESLQVVTYERLTGKELGRVTLRRYVDYTIDNYTGIVTLIQPLDMVTPDFDTVRVLATYRLTDKLQNREWAYGAEATYNTEQVKFGVGAVQMDDKLTYGARATFDNKDGVKADARVAYAGGVQASLDAEAQLREKDRASLQVRYQDEQYDGLNEFTPGLSVAGKYHAEFSDLLSGDLSADYRRDATVEQGNIRGYVDYRLRPFTAGAGLRYAFGDQEGLSAIGRVGYNLDPLSVSLEHEQPLTGNVKAVTTFGTRYRVSENVSLGLQDKYTWGEGHRAILGLDSRVGNTNYSVGYELPTADGDGNRARFGVQTSLPLNERTTLGLRGSVLYDIPLSRWDVGAGADVLFKADYYTATAGVDVNWRPNKDGDNEFGTVLRGGVTGSLSEHLTLSADGLADLRASGNGYRLGLGYGYRNRNLSSLGYARYVDGTLAGDRPQFLTGVSAEYRMPTWAVRAGADTRLLLNDANSFTAQGFLGGTAYITDYFGVGAWGRVLTQPATDTVLTGYGIEASLRALPGTWLSAGYNFAGFEGLPSAYTYTKPGAYVRLDLILDETLLGQDTEDRQVAPVRSEAEQAETVKLVRP